MKTGFDAVLLDLDGTLIDTEPVWMAQEQALVAEFGGVWTAAQALACVGNSLPRTAQALRELGGVPLPEEVIVGRLLDEVVAVVRREVPWRPGAKRLLRLLGEAGVPCALVTMSYRRLAEAALADLPAGTFAAVVTGDEVCHGKPHPEPYLRAASRLGVDVTGCLVLEDSPAGVASGVAAGARVIAVRGAAPLGELPENVSVVRGLAEVTGSIWPDQVISLL